MWLEALLVALVLIALDYLGRFHLQRSLGNLPHVSKIPVIGALLELSKFKPENLHLKFAEFVERFGKTFVARIAGIVFVVTADSRYIDVILTSQQHVRKHVVYNMLSSWLGNGLLLSSGQHWQTMRKIITPTFHFRILEQFVDVFDRQSEILVKKLVSYADGKTVVDIYPYMGLAALDIITETSMGVSVGAQLDTKSDIVNAVNDVTNILATRLMRPHLAFKLLFRILWPSAYRKQIDGIELMHKFTNAIIEERRQVLQQQQEVIGDENTATTNNNESDNGIGIKQRMALLDVLLQSKIDGQPLTDKQIRDEVNTFVFEGHDTTSSATSFCLYLLSRHAEVQRTLFEEIREHFGDDLGRPICYADLQELNYLNCVIKEALRVYPPIPAIGRWLKEDCKFDNVTFPAGTNVIIMLWVLLRDPLVFPEPELFRPERHLEKNEQAQAYSYIPFSAGPRNCIGQRFALYETKTMVIKFLRHYELLPLGDSVEPSIKIVLRSKNGINFGLKPRVY